MKIGTVVCLNSGGPWLCVTAVGGNSVNVVWFTHGAVSYATFPQDAVTVVDTSKAANSHATTST